MANLLKRASATAAIATSLVGISAVAAPQALAGNNDDGNVALQAGNESKQSIANSSSSGYMSPNMALIQGGVINCFGMNKIPLQGVVGGAIGVGVGLQDILTDQVNQVCSPNAMQQTGDDPLAHVLSSVLSENG
ncbi:rodlin [Yinghuangia sp. YIM S09857]|uniref:rodlin n=1 Tax=Yinghuangia sp. YIM S09857 TaxID=3436929 RepID=UPI003F52B818